MAFKDGDNGENFLTALGRLFGSGDTNYTTKISSNTSTLPKMWEINQPIVDKKFVLQKLNELEQKVKELKEELEKIKEL